MIKPTPKISEEEFNKLAAELEAILGRYHPYVRGAAIAGMLTNWLGALPSEQRAQVFEKFLKSVFASIEGLNSLAKGTRTHVARVALTFALGSNSNK